MNSLRNYRCLRTFGNFVPQCAYAGDSDFHCVANLHRADARRGARHDDISWKESHHFGDKAYKLVGVEDHVGRKRGLHDFAVEEKLNLEVCRIDVCFDPGTDG